MTLPHDNPTREIPLSKGYVAIVDADDYERVSAYKWTATVKNCGVYAYRGTKGEPRATQYLHHFILNVPGKIEVDHANRDTLDYRKQNLRIATHSQNQANRGLQKNNRTGYRGASRHRQQWQARLKHNGKNHYLGLYKTVEEAARAYDEKAREVFGEFASLNFPD